MVVGFVEGISVGVFHRLGDRGEKISVGLPNEYSPNTVKRFSFFVLSFLRSFPFLFTIFSRIFEYLSHSAFAPLFSFIFVLYPGQQQRAGRSLFQQNYTIKRQTFVPRIINGSKQRGESLLLGTRQRQSFIIAKITREEDQEKGFFFRNIHLRLILPKQRGNRRARMRAAPFSGFIVDRRSVTQTMLPIQQYYISTVYGETGRVQARARTRLFGTWMCYILQPRRVNGFQSIFFYMLFHLFFVFFLYSCI